MKWFLYYLAIQVILSLIFWFYSKRKDKRYKTKCEKPSEGFEPTEEVSIDPVSKVLTRVYVNPKTGDRLYIEEKGGGRE